MESVKKVEFNGNLITYATRDSILLAVLRIIDGDARIKRERGIELVETHESTKVVVNGDIHIHSTCDPELLFCQMTVSGGKHELQPDMLTVSPY